MKQKKTPQITWHSHVFFSHTHPLNGKHKNPETVKRHNIKIIKDCLDMQRQSIQMSKIEKFRDTYLQEEN